MESRSHGLREMSIRTAGRGRASARPRTGTWRRFRGDPTIRPLRAHNSIGSRSRSSESRCTGNSAFSASTANGESPRTTQRLELTTGTRSAASPSSPSTGTNLYLSCASLETCDAAKDDHPFRWDDADMPRPVDFRYEDVVGFTSRGEVYIRWVRLFFVERFPPCSWAFRSRALSWVRRAGGQHSPPPVFGPPEQAARLDHDAWALRSAPPAHPPGHSRGVLVRFDGKGDASAMAVVTTRFSGRAKQRLPEC